MRAINVIKEQFGSEVVLKELLYDTGWSKVYGITIDNKECVLKIKEGRRYGGKRFVELKNTLINRGVPLAETLYAKEGIEVEERIPGINLLNYNRYTQEHEGDSLTRINDNVDLNNNLVKVTKNIAKQLKKFHVNIRDINPILYRDRDIVSEITDEFDSIFEHLNVEDTYRSRVEDFKEYYTKWEKTIEFDKIGVIHGDLHNMGNIMVLESGEVVFIDYESISLGDPGRDLCQLLRCIITNDIYRIIFLKTYTEGMAKEYKKYLERSITMYWIMELINDMGSTQSSSRSVKEFRTAYKKIIIRNEPIIKLI